jgi:ArsR family transcriptional regulator
MDILKQLKALADATRLRLYVVLLKHELNVNELVQVMDMGQSRISRHLKVLTDCSLLSSRRDGFFVYYHAPLSQDNQELVQYLNKAVRPGSVYEGDLLRAGEVLEGRTQQTRLFFNRVAAHWQRLKNDILGDFDLSARVLQAVPETSALADLGCGTGELLPRFAEKCRRVIGVDSSPEMLARARELVSGDSRSIELRLGELEHLPLGTGEVDVAVLNMVLHHVSLPAAGIREAARVLQHQGLLLITDFAKHDQEAIRKTYGGVWLGFSRNEMLQWLKDSGLQAETLQEHPVNHGLMINVYIARKSETGRRNNGQYTNL